MNYKTQDQIPLEWQPGDVVLDKYEIREVFEGGGMGRVYRAYDREWNIDLAIKSPRENYYKTQAQIDLFLAEAEKWMRLGMHPNLTTCFYVQALGSTPRLFAEFVEGGTLSDWIASGRYSRLDGNGKLRSILGLAIQFARGLEYSHNKGLIHQDVKPANVLMTITGSPKVTDFGLANARLPESGTASESDAGRTILVPGSGFFTEAYASPEQAAGQPLSRKTDIWSWAVSMIEAIVGGRDWTHGLAAPFVLQRIYTNGYVNASIFGLLNDCLERRPEHRPESFSNIIQRLQEIFEETLGEKFPDIEKDMPALSADSLNNRAVSLITIGKAFGDAPNDGLSLLYNLRTISTRHILGKINLMLLNWRSGQTSTWTITKELEDLMSRPDFYEFVNEKWIFNYYIQNIRHEKAIKFVSRLNHKTLESEAQTAVADLTRIRESLLDLFNGLDGSYKKSAMSCLGLSIHHSPSEALVDTSAPDYGIIGYKFGDTLRIIDLNSTTLFEVEEVDSFCLSEDGSKLLILNFESSDEQFKDKGYCSFTCRIFDINTGIKTHDLPSGFGMPGPPGRYCIDYKLTISSDGLSASIWICEGNRWTTIDYEFDHKKNNWSVFHDFRKQNSVQSARLLKVLANGTRLIAVNGSYIEIWEMERTVIVRCLLAINLDEFGVIRIEGCLPGFRMWRGWEFEADVWNIYRIFESLMRLESRNPDPYIIVKPPDYDSMADRQQRLSVLLDDMYRFEASDNRAMVLDRVDRILVFEASTGIDLFQKRHEIVSTHPCRVLSKVWHEDSKNQYWDTEIFGVNSEIENLFVLKRYRRINDLNLGLYSKLDGRRHSDCLFALEHREGWQDESWFGVCIVTSETSLYLVKNSRNYESDYSVVLINDGGRECEKIINEWDLNSNDSKWETFTNQFVVIEDRIIYRDCTNGIWIRDACTGEKLHHTVVDDEISIIRKVAFTDSICLAVGTASTGRLFIYDKEGNQLTSIDVGLGQGGFVEDVSYTCSVAVLKKRNHSWVYIDLLNRREKIICNRFFDDHSRWGFDVDIGFRLSQCGRAVVGYEGGSLWLVDLRSGKEVYRWRPPAGLLVPPCFDASGRWLLVVHSKNSYEVLQLFWDIDEKGESFDLDIN